jgi:phosphoenolpyruvate-protein phosphotransferase (PTS system enzyme I)
VNISSISGEMWLQGRSIVAGVALGTIYCIYPSRVSVRSSGEAEEISPEFELQRFYSALERSQKELDVLCKKLKQDNLCYESEIVEMQSILVRDVIFNREVSEYIQKFFKRADVAIYDFLDKYRTRFSHIPGALIRQRFEDIEGVCHRVLSCLVAQERGGFGFEETSIIFSESAAVTLLCQSGLKQIKALVTTNGGAMSHTAIIAKSQGIPYVTGISLDSITHSLHGREVIVDGLTGLVIVDPQEETKKRYMSLKEAHDEFIKGNAVKPRLKARTKDGTRVFLYGNVGSVSEAETLSDHGMDGVGLYRSEYLVLEKGHFPGEEEQYQAFSSIVKASKGKRVVLRVFDFANDKKWSSIGNAIPHFKEGKRTIPLLLEYEDLFLQHLTALVKASAYGPVGILFPMVGSIDEMDACLQIYEKACVALQLSPQMRPQIGAMIEVPSMACKISELKDRVQFLALGTNDLLSHTLGLDRTDDSLSNHLFERHPGFLQLVAHVAQESAKVSLPLSLCGEMASDPLMIPFVIGLKIHRLSITPRLAPMVKHVLRSYTVEEAEKIAQDVLSLTSPEEIDSLLKKRYCSTYGG